MAVEHLLSGDDKTRRVWLDSVEIRPERSQAIYNHSPDGFNWGYGGSGPAQLALAIMLEIRDEGAALGMYQHFKQDVIAQLDQAPFVIVFWEDAGHWKWKNAIVV